MKNQFLFLILVLLLLADNSFAQKPKKPAKQESDLLDFDEYKSKNPKSEKEPAKTDTTWNSQLLDFGDYDWKEENVQKSELFKTVTIGSQVWMAENLQVSTFRNGNPIPEIKDDMGWLKTAIDHTEAWCYYNDDKANGAKYGKLYNYDAVKDSRGLAPKGWHVPTTAEWEILFNDLGGESFAGKKMISSSGWNEINKNVTNQSGFTALPGGFREELGKCLNLGESAYYITSTQDPNTYHIHSGYGFKISSDGIISKKIYDNDGLSVRCVKD